MKQDKILLGHGSGGRMTHRLIKELFYKYFNNSFLNQQSDSAILPVKTNKLAFTTDSFVVDPVFFAGGNIGKLAIAGTVNDLAVSGAKPLYISCGFIIEEGFALQDLEAIVKSMAEEAGKAGLKIVTGDTKVVQKGQCDKIFINTSGVGELDEKYTAISEGKNIRNGDVIIINGSIGDHGMAIMAEREELNLQSKIQSDCACLNSLIFEMLEVCPDVRFMRDATRGGLAGVLFDLAEKHGLGIDVWEERIKVKENVRGLCEILGFDPIYVANEGKVVFVVPEKKAEQVLAAIRKNPLGKESEIIGKFVNEHHGKAWLHTSFGGKRIIDMLAGEQLPRIC